MNSILSFKFVQDLSSIGIAFALHYVARKDYIIYYSVGLNVKFSK